MFNRKHIFVFLIFSLLATVCAFFYAKMENTRIINVYGFHQLNQDAALDQACIAKVFQITKNAVHLDNCYMTFIEAKSRVESEGDSLKIISPKLNLDINTDLQIEYSEKQICWTY